MTHGSSATPINARSCARNGSTETPLELVLAAFPVFFHVIEGRALARFVETPPGRELTADAASDDGRWKQRPEVSVVGRDLARRSPKKVTEGHTQWGGETMHVEDKHIAERNRRQHERVTCRTDVTLEGDSTFYNGFTENIGAGGLFIATYDALEIGRRVNLEFTLPDHEARISVEGEVRWLREYNELTPDIVPGMGIKFLDLKQGDLFAVERFVALKEPLFYDE